MNHETYQACREALSEAREALDTAATTDSPAIATAACRRAIELCLLLDREIHGTDYPPDLDMPEALHRFQRRHSDALGRDMILDSEPVLAATNRPATPPPPTLARDAESLERVFLPAAQAIRRMLDEVTAGLCRPRRRGPFIVAAGVIAIAGLVVGIRWILMMTSSEGFTVTYFRGVNFETSVARRVEPELFKDYGEARPAWFVPRNRYSARWEGTLMVPATTNYSFYSQRAGGIRVRIDGACVIDEWKERSWRTSGSHGSVTLRAGEHPIVVEYFKNQGQGALRLRWGGGPIPDNTVVGVPYVRR